MRYFARFGEVIDCVVMKNAETGRSRGFGFVTFADPTNIEAVLLNCPHNLDGRTIDPKACNPRSMQKPKKATTQHCPKVINLLGRLIRSLAKALVVQVFLGGLPSSITETDLRSFFSRYGEVVEVVIMYDQEKKKSRGFGFLSFGDEVACSRAVAEHFVNIQNKQVEIKRAEPRTNQQQMHHPHHAPPTPGLGKATVYYFRDTKTLTLHFLFIDRLDWSPTNSGTNGHAMHPPPPSHAIMPPPPPPAPSHTPQGTAAPAPGYSPQPQQQWGAPPPGTPGPPMPPVSHQQSTAYPLQYGNPPPPAAAGAAATQVSWGQPPPGVPPPTGQPAPAGTAPWGAPSASPYPGQPHHAAGPPPGM